MIVAAVVFLPRGAKAEPGDLASEAAGIETPRHPGGPGLAGMTLGQAMAACRTPGLSLAVVDGFEIRWARGVGVTDHFTQRDVTAATMFQAASISKPVAAMAALKAVQEGVFGLDDDINTVLKTWKLPRTRRTGKRIVTPRLLLSHTAGTTVSGFPGYDPRGPIPTVRQVLAGEPPAVTGPVVVDIPPFTRFRYSGGGSTVLQFALTEALGRPYADILQAAVLHPLGMCNSTFLQPLPEALEDQAAWGHACSGAQTEMGTSDPLPWHVYPEQAAAGLWTTAADLAQFCVEILKSAHGKSNRVLDVEHTLLMITPVGLGPDGLGFRTRLRGRDSIGGEPPAFFFHTGVNHGFQALLFGDADSGFGFAILANSDQAGPLVMDELPRRLARQYGWTLPEPWGEFTARPSSRRQKAPWWAWSLLAGAAAVIVLWMRSL